MKKTFEESMKELEEIVKKLDSGELTLDKSVELFKEGMELSNYCNKLLEDAEKNISVLVEQSDGIIVEEKFEVDTDDEE